MSSPTASTDSLNRFTALTPTRSRLAYLELVPVLPWLMMIAKYRNLADTIVRQHDNLDGYQAILNRMTWGDLFSAPGTMLPYLLGGLPRDFLGSEFGIGNLIGVALPLMWSLFASEFVIRTLAFVGMTLLLRTAGIGRYRLITYGIATIFALLPFYGPSFGAVAAVPFLLAAFLHTLQIGRLDARSALAFALFPLVASAVVAIPYIALLLLAIVVLAPLLRKRVAPPALGVAVLSLSVVAIHWRIFYALLFGPTTHRVEQVRTARPYGWSMLERFGDSLVEEYAHAALGKSWIIALVLAAAGVVLVLGWRSIDPRRKWLTVGLFGTLALTTAIGQLWSPFETHVIKELFDGWGQFQMERVRWAEPTIVYLLFALSLATLVDRIGVGRARRWLVPAVLIVGLAVQAWTVVSLQRFVQAPNSLSVREFYAPETMADIKTAIDDDGGHLAISVGLHPAVAVANGINSADGYATAYPLEYKHRFRELIAPALELMTPKNRAYFDDWGSRAYVFQPDLPLRASYSRPPQCDDRDLIVNTSAYEDLNITHVISACRLTNAPAVDLRLMLETGFDNELGPIWLYRVTRETP